jgi:glycosyltransferase involved in cell wall biosynthesis
VPRISVIIPCLNGAADIPDQLRALAGQTWSGWWEVVVADNGSTDGSGDARSSLREAARDWARLLVHLPDLRDRDADAFYIHLLGHRRGRLQGSLRHRVVFL